MPDDTAVQPPEHPADASDTPVEDVPVTVGPVETTFPPLEPEELIPPVPDEESAAQGGETPSGETPPPLETTSGSNNTLVGCLRDVAVVLLAMILSAAFVIFILLALNGTLFLNDRDKATQLALEQQRLEDQMTQFQSQLAQQGEALQSLEGRMSSVEEQLDGLIQRVDHQQGQLEALQARTDEIEQAAEASRQELATVQQQQEALAARMDDLAQANKALEETIATIQTDIAGFQQVAGRFNRFVEGMTRLIAEVAVEDAAASQATSTLTPVPSPQATEPITPTATITATPTITPTQTITPTGPETSQALTLFPPAQPIPTPEPHRGVVFGLVWEDANGNGQPDAGERPVAGVRVTLRNPRGRALLDMVTGPDGRYAFLNLPPGEYRLQLIPETGVTLTTDNPQDLFVVANQSLEVNFGVRSAQP